jgi:hypothetical protein
MKRGDIREDGKQLWSIGKTGERAGYQYWVAQEKYAQLLEKSRAKNRAKDRGQNLAYHRARRRVDYRAAMLARIKSRAAHYGLPFDLTRNDIPLITHCPIFGFELKVGDGIVSPQSPSLDRIDPNLGYVKGNVIVISNKANLIKSSATPDEILKVGEFFKNLNPLFTTQQGSKYNGRAEGIVPKLSQPPGVNIMSKLLEDPKVAALVEKEVAKAKKEATKAALAAVKEAVDANKEVEDKGIKKAVAEVLKSVTAGIKEAA